MTPYRFTFDGTPLTAVPGQTLAAALWAAGITSWRTTRHRRAPRGAFCFIGTCHDCLATVNGRPNQRACLVPVRPGDTVTTQHGTGHDSDRAGLDSDGMGHGVHRTGLESDDTGHDSDRAGLDSDGTGHGADRTAPGPLPPGTGRGPRAADADRRPPAPGEAPDARAGEHRP
ncbi:hypothetical protein SUDANB99_04856 [Streptomyces sp. enrichment culture]